MRKFFLPFILLIPLLLLSTSCNRTAAETSVSTDRTPDHLVQLENAVRDQLNISTNVPFEQMKSYDYKAVTARMHKVEKSMSSAAPFLDSYHDVFPIQRMESIDSAHVAVVYPLRLNSGKIIFTYIVFARENSDSGERWIDSLERYYVSRSLCYDDFSSIQPGDPYDKIAAIEPSLDCYTVDDPEQIVAALLLTDGVLEIEFERTENDTLVKLMQFYPWGSKDAPKEYAILKAEKGAITLPPND